MKSYIREKSYYNLGKKVSDSRLHIDISKKKYK